ncbi:hypothetical protein HYPSUDRAFT_662093 [Hypholoma sublateritium FD-334 SS-4]|uniref:Uncharacterized protein n=1 Tax=Hypholoma sublateritium (strain FD-334 SS-4) TaxID=945553 RepID=A0A0D2PR00_HYPSF|nr:hypothetical protein HYPSUDRAFT_662093 [Hypholoma sublateritium FD-334 SS-4]
MTCVNQGPPPTRALPPACSVRALRRSRSTTLRVSALRTERSPHSHRPRSRFLVGDCAAWSASGSCPYGSNWRTKTASIGPIIDTAQISRRFVESCGRPHIRVRSAPCTAVESLDPISTECASVRCTRRCVAHAEYPADRISPPALYMR